jgi:hypothetical protein
MNVNYGALRLGQFEEYVVRELAHRGMYAKSRSGVIRAIFTEKIFSPEGVTPPRLENDDTLADIVDNYQADNIGAPATGIVRRRIECWVHSHNEELARLGITRENARRTRHVGKNVLKLLE